MPTETNPSDSSRPFDSPGLSDTQDTHEPWRPALHVTASTGFINDPNGLIEIEGHSHVFYQHNPDATVHGPMHWGHAVSTDLVNWQELPIALYPDGLGQCFSGSAVLTPDGSVALIYTAHQDREGQDALQTQCLVRADRKLTTFVSEPSNPVLGNTEQLEDYRDPKVFWHTPSSAWVMLITHGRHVGIYRSTDLVSWTFASEFGQGLGAPGEGAWECPDLVEVNSTDGDRRWVLIVGVWSGAPGEGSGTQYFVGDFDGVHFSQDESFPEIQWFDHGRDCYAAQSFAGRDGLAPRVMAWCSNWQYANNTPTVDFRGSLSLPRDLDLVQTSTGTRLRQRVPEAARAAFAPYEEGDAPPGAVYRVTRSVSLTPGESMQVRLFGEEKPQFVIERPQHEERWKLHVSRDALPGEGAELAAFASGYVVELAKTGDEPLELELFADHGLVELFLGGGVDVVTMCYYPAEVGGVVRIVHSP